MLIEEGWLTEVAEALAYYDENEDWPEDADPRIVILAENMERYGRRAVEIFNNQWMKDHWEEEAHDHSERDQVPD